MTVLHYIGAAIVLSLIVGMGISSGKRVKSADDFATGGRKSGVGLIVGATVGTLIGGAATIGTAQLSFAYGFSAAWFTLGCGASCLILGLFFADKLNGSGISTLPEIFAREYSQRAGTIAMALTSIGMMLSIISQVLSGIALITAISSIGTLLSALIVLLLMLAYIFFGGAIGAGYVGILKTILMCVAVGGCGILALCLQDGGFFGFVATLPRERYFSLLARGPAVDLGAALSMVIGVLSTQAYIQPLIAARSVAVARTGSIISAIVSPIIGSGGIFVGLFMRVHHPDIVPATALPAFIIEYLPPLIGGGILAVLLVALVGTGAGVSLAISTMFSHDIYKVYINKNASDKRCLMINRLSILVLLTSAAIISTNNFGSLILGWSFMSTGLRGAVACAPLITALFLPGRVPEKYAVTAMIIGPALVLLGKLFLPSSIDSLFLGFGASVIVLCLGIAKTRHKRTNIGSNIGI